VTDHFFVVGSGRCGTKMLRRMLIPHPEVVVPIETHFLPTLHDEFGTEPTTFDEYVAVVDEHYDTAGRPWVDTLCEMAGRDYGAFPDGFRAVCDRERATAAEFTEAFHRFLYGAEPTVVGDKTPHYGVVTEELTDLWPDARFVHLVRDGVHAAASMTRHPGFRRQIAAGVALEDLDRISYRGRLATLPDESIDAREAAEFWGRIVTETRRQGRALPDDRYVEVRYEDLLLDPESELRRLGEFLGIDATGDWLRRGSAVPYPFAIHRTEDRIDEDRYREIAEPIRAELESFGYPVDDLAYPSVVAELGRSLDYYRYNAFDAYYWKKTIGRRLPGR
jgi:hypothetical protein